MSEYVLDPSLTDRSVDKCRDFEKWRLLQFCSHRGFTDYKKAQPISSDENYILRATYKILLIFIPLHKHKNVYVLSIWTRKAVKIFILFPCDRPCHTSCLIREGSPVQMFFSSSCYTYIHIKDQFQVKNGFNFCTIIRREARERLSHFLRRQNCFKQVCLQECMGKHPCSKLIARSTHYETRLFHASKDERARSTNSIVSYHNI